jgi:hypothetical protein
MYDALTPGYPWYGADLGIAVLDGGIPAPIGDVSNVYSFGVPVQYDVMPGIGGLDLIGGIRDDVECSLRDSVERLASRGARIAFTGCGMLGQYQRIAADAAPIPIGTSSLLQVPLALRVVPTSQRVLVLGVDRAWVRDEHLVECGVHPGELDRVIVRGLEAAPHFRGNLLGEFDVFDPERARDEVLAVLADAIEESPEIAAVVFECTNLGPYSAAARTRFGIPVWDAIALADWLAAGVTTPQLAVPSAPSTRG